MEFANCYSKKIVTEDAKSYFKNWQQSASTNTEKQNDTIVIE